MKRAGGLYGRITDPDNIREAFWKAARGKQERRDRIAFQQDLDANVRRIYEQLTNGAVRVGNYRFFYVHDPKKRKICAADFSERVLHHAVMNVCEPVLDAAAIFDSYACRKGKGTHKAVHRARLFARCYPWYLKLDIHRYFDSIDHGIAIRLLSRKIKDPAVLRLFETILATYSTRPGKGLPIGNLISQHLANFYLNPFDHWVKEECRIKGYLRYMDDFVLFGESRGDLKNRLSEIRDFLDRRLGLALNPKIQLNRSRWGVPFLGLRVFATKILLSPASRRRFIAKFKRYEANREEEIWSTQDLVRHMEPLVGFTRVADAAGFRRNVIHRYGVSF